MLLILKMQSFATRGYMTLLDLGCAPRFCSNIAIGLCVATCSVNFHFFLGGGVFSAVFEIFACLIFKKIFNLYKSGVSNLLPAVPELCRLLYCKMWPRLYYWWCGRILVRAYNVTACVLCSSYWAAKGSDSEYLCSHYLNVSERAVGTLKWHLLEYTFSFEVVNLDTKEMLKKYDF